MIPNEYRPIELNDLQRSHRERMERLGFTIAQRPFRGRDGLRWHCSRVIEGTDRDFSVCLTTGRLTGWGCGTNLTAVEVDRWLSSVDESQSTSAPPVVAAQLPEASADTGSSFCGSLEAAGFLAIRESTSANGLGPKYFATRSDGSRWLCDSVTGVLTCFEPGPWRLFILRGGRLVNREDSSPYESRSETPRPRAKPPAEIRPAVPMPDPCPIQSTAVVSGRRQLSLFGD